MLNTTIQRIRPLFARGLLAALILLPVSWVVMVGLLFWSARRDRTPRRSWRTHSQSVTRSSLPWPSLIEGTVAIRRD